MIRQLGTPPTPIDCIVFFKRGGTALSSTSRTSVRKAARRSAIIASNPISSFLSALLDDCFRSARRHSIIAEVFKLEDISSDIGQASGRAALSQLGNSTVNF